MAAARTLAPGRWHGAGVAFGYHHDLHLEPADAGVGRGVDPAALARLIRLVGPDFVQADSKGHPGWTSWFSRTPGASVAPGLEKDLVAAWRDATRRLGLPLHAHYSGLWDKAAGAKRPDWCVIRADGTPSRSPWNGVTGDAGDKMCPRGGYARELMVPQLLELARGWGVDGFWIDGDIWAAEPCWCTRCREAWRARGGIGDPPRDPGEPGWADWWNFTRESFEAYVAGYVEALHREAPGALVCSNWLQTFRHPGPPAIATDWISGDNTAMWGLDSGRCEARFISTRGKPWDIMQWDFCFPRGWLGDPEWTTTVKPVEMLAQEAAVTLALGGGVQVCDNPFSGLREGQLAEWRLRRAGQLARFVRRRKALCRGTETHAQVAVLHSEMHARAHPVGGSPRDIDTSPVQGAVYSLLECSLGVDVLDEWALGPRLEEFPVVVAPEQDDMDPAMADALAGWIRAGGRLLVSGAGAAKSFGEDLLGVRVRSLSGPAVRWVPASAGSDDGAVAAWSARWADAEPRGARVLLGPSGESPSRVDKLLPWPTAFLHRVGRGAVSWITFDAFRAFERSRFPMLRSFVAAAAAPLLRGLDVRARAPACVDVVLRRRGPRTIVHLVNRGPGLPAAPHAGIVDGIAPAGPVTITLRGALAASRARAAFEGTAIRAERAGAGARRLRVEAVRIHEAIVLEPAPTPARGRRGRHSGRAAQKKR